MRPAAGCNREAGAQLFVTTSSRFMRRIINNAPLEHCTWCIGAEEAEQLTFTLTLAPRTARRTRPGPATKRTWKVGRYYIAWYITPSLKKIIAHVL